MDSEAVLTEIGELCLFLFKNNGSLLLTIVGIIGLSLCRKHRERMPNVSKRVSIASLVLLLRSIAIPLVVYYFPHKLQFEGFDLVYKVAYLALEAVAFWLLLSVAFRDT